MSTETKSAPAGSAETEPASPNSGAGPSVPFRNPKKTKPTRILPSDRLTSEKHLEALRAFVVAEQAKGGAVTNDEAGKIIGMSGQTVVVCNPFFVDVGLLIRNDSGLFSAGQAAKDYQAAYEWDATSAGTKLASALRDTWFAKVLTPRLKMRALTKAEALGFLAEASKASPEYQGRLLVLLDFLNVAGIVSLAGDEVRAGAESSGGTHGSGSGGPGGNGAGGAEPPKPPVGEMIPLDAPFIYIDPGKTKKVVLVAPDSSVTRKEFDRIKAWFDLQFFISDEKAE